MTEPEPKFSSELDLRFEEIIGKKVIENANQTYLEIGKIVQKIDEIEREKNKPLRKLQNWIGAIVLSIVSSALFQIFGPNNYVAQAVSAVPQISDHGFNKQAYGNLKSKTRKKHWKSK